VEHCISRATDYQRLRCQSGFSVVCPFPAIWLSLQVLPLPLGPTTHGLGPASRRVAGTTERTKETAIMAQARIGLYEGLFLINQNVATDLNSAVEHVKSILTRAEAEIVILRKWDERKLAYPVRGLKRGVYLLAYFKARASQIANIDRDCNLSEQILRSLIISAEHAGEVELELARKEVPAVVEARLRGPDDRTRAPGSTPAPGAPAAPGATPAPGGPGLAPAPAPATATAVAVAPSTPKAESPTA
jgi:small subunit ribosomal protein S6